MGVLPLQFIDGISWDQLQLTGAETVSVGGVRELTPRQRVNLRISRSNGRVDEVEVQCRIDTENEVLYFRNGGILHYVLRGLAKAD